MNFEEATALVRQREYWQEAAERHYRNAKVCGAYALGMIGFTSVSIAKLVTQKELDPYIVTTTVGLFGANSMLKELRSNINTANHYSRRVAQAEAPNSANPETKPATDQQKY